MKYKSLSWIFVLLLLVGFATATSTCNSLDFTSSTVDTTGLSTGDDVSLNLSMNVSVSMDFDGDMCTTASLSIDPTCDCGGGYIEFTRCHGDPEILLTAGDNYDFASFVHNDSTFTVVANINLIDATTTFIIDGITYGAINYQSGSYNLGEGIDIHSEGDSFGSELNITSASACSNSFNPKYNFYLRDINDLPINNYFVMVTDLDNISVNNYSLNYSINNYYDGGIVCKLPSNNDAVLIRNLSITNDGMYIPNINLLYRSTFASSTVTVFAKYFYSDGSIGTSNILGTTSTSYISGVLSGSNSSNRLSYVELWGTTSKHTVNNEQVCTDNVNVSNILPVNNFSLNPNTNYNFFINKLNYAHFNQSIVTNNDNSQGNVFVLHPYNDVLFNTYTELGGVLVTNATTITLSNQFNSYSGTTVNGSLRFINITTGNYSFTTNNSLYSVRTGYVVVADGSNQTYNIYLANSTAVLLNFRAVGGAAISGVFVNVKSFVNGSLVSVESGLSGVDGAFQFGGLMNKYYFISVSKDGYAPYSFELNPILYTSYTIPLSVLVSGTVTPTAYAVWYPNTFIKGRSTDFRIQFYSPYNSLISYSYFLDYPNGNDSNIGFSSGGETFSNSFIIVNGSRNDFVRLNITWFLSDGSSQTNSYSYPLIVQLTNRTIMTGNDKGYGFLIGDKVFLTAIILLIVMGIAWLALGFFGSLAIGGIVLTILLNSNLFTASEAQLYIASGVLVVILLIFRGRQ
jgi:hypothetical protein